MQQTKNNLSLANLRLGAFYIEGVRLIPDSVNSTERVTQLSHLISGHFELIKDVRGSDSAWGYKRLVVNCTYQITMTAEGQCKLTSLNICPDGVIVRLTAADLTDFRIDNIYTLADLSERCQNSIQLNQIYDFVDQDIFARYLRSRRELLLSYVELKAAS